MSEQTVAVGEDFAVGGIRPRIVVGVDGSPSALAALQWAARMAELLGARVEAVSVPDRASSWYGYSVEAEIVSPHDDAVRGLAGAVATVFGEAPAVDVTQVVAAGRGAAETLVDAARGAALLVVGAHGRAGLASGVADRLLGSVSTACAADAPCPVVIVPAPA